MEKKLNFIITPFLIALTPLLHMYAKNTKEIMVGEIILLFIPISLLLGSSIFLTNVLYKSIQKSSLITAYGSLFFFYFHYVIEAYNTHITSIYKIGFLHLRYILIFILIFFIFLIYKISKQRTLSLQNNLLKITFATLIFFSFTEISKKKIIQLTSKETSFKKNYNFFKKIITASNKKTSPNKPDIYFIILDMYTSQKTLNKYCNFDNSSFISNLKNLGFTVLNNSYSNYSTTQASLSSSLNMQFHTTCPPFIPLIENNNVFKFLNHHNYKIYNLKSCSSIFNAINHKKSNPIVNYFTNSWNKLFSTFDFFYYFLKYKTFLLYFPFIDSLENKRHIKNIKQQFNKLINSTQLKGPKFIFCHILCPHPPYLFNENGQAYKKRNFEKKIFYPKQIKFVNKEIKPILKKIINKNPNNTIIILQGDHGLENPQLLVNALKQKKSKKEITNLVKNVFTNLNAWYWPKSTNKKLLKKHFSPVNNFRLIFNEYFHTNLKLKINKIFISNNEGKNTTLQIIPPSYVDF